MIYQIANGSKHYGVNDVFNNINFQINENEKVALIGRNGCGKSTILKIILKEEELSYGNTSSKNNIRIGYLSQTTFKDENITLQQAIDDSLEYILSIKNKLNELETLMKDDSSEELLEKYAKLSISFDAIGGYNYQNEVLTLLTKFKFKKDDINRQIKTFSGGQKTRLAFITLLISKPDLLLLDEPTNHLDLSTIEWLEGYLKRYPKAILLVSHDRMFIDNIVSVVYELEYGSLKKYIGNYSAYEITKKNDDEKNRSAYYRQQKEIERMEALIEKFRYKATKASFAQSKIKQLDKIERITRNTNDTKSFKATFKCKTKGGNDVLKMSDLAIGYDSILASITLDVYRHDRICIIGDNGTGKSTLLKTITQEIKPIKGHYLFGHQIEIGYFDQNHIQFNDNKTVLEEVWDDYPELDQTSIRTILGNFLFSADDVFKQTTVLSGGEKVRLALVKLVLLSPNLLILDEPTNHLDIIGKQALEKALKDYDGTIIMVSHDRYFIRNIAKSILHLDGGIAKHYNYGYQQFIDDSKTTKENTITKNETIIKTNKLSNNRLNFLQENINRLENDIKYNKELLFKEEYYSNHILYKEVEDLINKLQVELDNYEVELLESIE